MFPKFTSLFFNLGGVRGTHKREVVRSALEEIFYLWLLRVDLNILAVSNSALVIHSWKGLD